MGGNKIVMSCRESSQIMNGERKVTSMKGAESEELWDSMCEKEEISNHGTQFTAFGLSQKYTQLCALCGGGGGGE